VKGAYMKQIISTYNDSGDIISSKESYYKEFDEEKGVLFRKKAYFYKGFKAINKLSDTGINPIDAGRLLFLAENTYADTNIISIYKNRRYIPATIEDISEIIDLCYSRAVTFINQMIEKSIVAKDTITINNTTETQYVLSPLYFMSSNYLSYHLYMIFRKQLDEVLPFKAKEFFNQYKGKPILLYKHEENNNDQLE
jgi:hypothetical protein